MSRIYRIKTKEEFKADGRLRPNGIPELWASNGAMNHFMGKTFPESAIRFSPAYSSFSIDGEAWAFSVKDIVIETTTPGLRTPIVIKGGGTALSNMLDATMDKISVTSAVMDFSKPVPVKKPKKVAITEGKDAYGDTVYAGDMVVFSPSSSTIYRGVVQSFTPKANPRVKIEGYGDYTVACMRPYIKVHVPLNGKRMVDLINTIK